MKNGKIIITYTLITFIFLSCIRDRNDKHLVDSLQFVGQESWNARITIMKDDVKRADVSAGHLIKYDDRKIIILNQGVAVDFFDKYGNHTSYLESDSAEINEKTNDMIAFGNVVVISDTGITLFTNHLKWDNKIEKIISNDDIILVTESDTLRGKGFESNTDLTEWVIKEPKGSIEKEIKAE
ncbi:MAG: LPS export ABC transporter periplasmic protein LptC [Candidatus Marinimicrobia bacterium]|nr:LPS export ABC transporter periplasmic protein LptC [Candidatus Neomarinimicrobiota bacterium]